MKRIFSAGLSVALACSLCLTPVSALTVQQAGALLEQFYVDQIPDSVLARRIWTPCWRPWVTPTPST